MAKFTDARHPSMMVRVWDPLVRVFHWSLVASFALAWFTSGARGELHQWAGYAAASLVLMRLLWGFIGTPYARFSQFVQGPKAVTKYLRAIITGNEVRHVGHNPAGGIMILALLLAISITALTGWLATTDSYYGDERVQILHSLCADGVLFLVLVHVGGVALASLHHREDLVKAMFTGRKRKAENTDIA